MSPSSALSVGISRGWVTQDLSVLGACSSASSRMVVSPVMDPGELVSPSGKIRSRSSSSSMLCTLFLLGGYPLPWVAILQLPATLLFLGWLRWQLVSCCCWVGCPCGVVPYLFIPYISCQCTNEGRPSIHKLTLAVSLYNMKTELTWPSRAVPLSL